MTYILAESEYYFVHNIVTGMGIQLKKIFGSHLIPNSVVKFISNNICMVYHLLI